MNPNISIPQLKTRDKKVYWPSTEDPREPQPEESSQMSLLSLFWASSSATFSHLSYYSQHYGNHLSSSSSQAAVNRGTNSSLNVLSSVTALWSQLCLTSCITPSSLPPSALWRWKDVRKKNNLWHSSDPSPSAGDAIDCVHITLWTLCQTLRAPIDIRTQSSYGPWSTCEAPTKPPPTPALVSSICAGQIEPFLRYDNFLLRNQSGWLWLW